MSDEAGDAARRIVESWKQTAKEHGVRVEDFLNQDSPSIADDCLTVALNHQRQAKRIEELENALRDIDALEPMEIDPSNYTHDEVCELSGNAVQAALIALVALKGE